MLLLVVANMASAQVQKVKYSLEFNAETCLFDVFINIEEGKTKTTTHRAQFNSQISIVTPTSTIVSVEETYMPLVNNQQYRSGKAASWEVTTLLDAPAVSPNEAFHSITPFLTPAAFYMDLEEGQKVRLFSLGLYPMVDCAANVRLYDNTTDPRSNDNGMRGGDFRNGFTVGGIIQTYAGNNPVLSPEKPVIKGFSKDKKELKAEVEINEASFCQAKVSYEWMKSGEVIKSGKSAPFLTNSQIKTGKYSLVVTDALGCRAERTISLSRGVHTSEKQLAVDHELAQREFKDTEVATSSSIYPNPAKDYVNVVVYGVAGKSIVANIVNLDGKIVKADVISGNILEGENQYKVSLSNLATGIYNVSIVVANEKAVNHKLIMVK